MRLTRKIFLYAFILSLVLSAYLAFDLYNFTRTVREQNLAFGEKVSTKVAFQMDSILKDVEQLAIAFGKKLTAQRPATKDSLEKKLRDISDQNPNLLGVTAAFEAYAFSTEEELYAPFYDKSKNEFIYCEDYYDYTNPKLETAQWYIQVREKGNRWIEPYFAGAAQTMVADFGVPIYEGPDNNSKVIGTVTATLSLSGLKKILNSLSLGKTGYAFAISQNGKFLVHPNSDYPKAGKNLLDSVLSPDSSSLLQIANQMLKGRRGYGAFKNRVTGQDSWLFYSPIKTSGWSVGLVMIKDEVIPDHQIINRKKINLALAIALTIVLGLILFSGVLKFGTKGFWRVSLGASFLIAGLIWFIWELELSSNKRIQQENAVYIADYAGLNSFLRGYEEKANVGKGEKPFYIPTGVFVEEVEFDDAYNVQVGGHIWQKFSSNIPRSIERSVSLPQVAPDAEAVNLSKTYHEQFNDYEVIGWEFRATLRLNFDYHIYPFDRREVGIKFRQNEFMHNVILTPDFDAYQTLIPSSLPGTVRDLVIPGWETEAAYFDYKINSYNANFGIEDYYGQNQVPEFHYNILFRRRILSPFISTIIPLLVVALMLFGVVYSTTKNKNKNTLAGFSAFNVVQACAAFFFVIILGHIDMRSGMNTEEITYIEYFYFIMYFVLLLVSFNVVLFSGPAPTKWLDFKDNLVMKIGYWPFLLILCLGITLLVFY